MPAATARRCLLTLEELGYVTRNGRSFLLRPKVLELGAAYLESINIEQLTRTHLEQLARETALATEEIARKLGISLATVKMHVRALLNLDEIPRPDDSADALAIAICHLHSRKYARMSEENGG